MNRLLLILTLLLTVRTEGLCQEAREIAPGKILIGEILVEQKTMEVSFPAEINMTNGIIEYLLVHQNGKVHESLLRTGTNPAQIHAACLLLGISVPQNMSQATNLTGHPLTISISTSNQTAKVFFPHDFVQHAKTSKPMMQPNWIYNGSMMVQGHFAATETGSIAALMKDRYAVINSNLPEAEDDSSWQIRANPPLTNGAPVTVTLRFAPLKK